MNLRPKRNGERPSKRPPQDQLMTTYGENLPPTPAESKSILSMGPRGRQP